MLIKICGVRSPKVAFDTANLGADYIGLMLYKGSKRYVDNVLASDIAQATKEGGAIPVAVFVDADIATIEDVCTKLSIDIVQAHGDAARKSIVNLSDKIVSRIAAIPVDNNGKLTIDSAYSDQLDPSRDFLLYDGLQGGSGSRIHVNINELSSFPFFMAGGLSEENVNEIIEKYQPLGVDVSSGVESQPGVKCILKIQQFIERVRG
jgi:phosphoribosylanthranilate isomerase